MKYMVLTSSDQYVFNATQNLEDQVKKLIVLGWKPLGGVSLSLGKNDWYHITQAMIKE